MGEAGAPSGMHDACMLSHYDTRTQYVEDGETTAYLAPTLEHDANTSITNARLSVPFCSVGNTNRQRRPIVGNFWYQLCTRF